jgi:hypothetical protein
VETKIFASAIIRRGDSTITKRYSVIALKRYSNGYTWGLIFISLKAVSVLWTKAAHSAKPTDLKQIMRSGQWQISSLGGLKHKMTLVIFEIDFML